VAFSTSHLSSILGIIYTPFGKGAAFWRRMESTIPRELSITQIKGMKLLLWFYWLLTSGEQKYDESERRRLERHPASLACRTRLCLSINPTRRLII